MLDKYPKDQSETGPKAELISDPYQPNVSFKPPI
jgi:hypothetical protein